MVNEKKPCSHEFKSDCKKSKSCGGWIVGQGCQGPKDVKKMRKVDCLASKNRRWKVGKGCEELLKPTTCARRTKADCLAHESTCDWIVGKGCKPKNQKMVPFSATPLRVPNPTPATPEAEAKEAVMQEKAPREPLPRKQAPKPLPRVPSTLYKCRPRYYASRIAIHDILNLPGWDLLTDEGKEYFRSFYDLRKSKNVRVTKDDLQYVNNEFLFYAVDQVVSIGDNIDEAIAYYIFEMMVFYQSEKFFNLINNNFMDTYPQGCGTRIIYD